MSNITNKIGCQAGGLKIVDPNNFDGMNSSSNMSVATEDLNISVVLRVKKKGRTVLSNTPDSGTRESTNNITINFMDGSNINGEKVLTTKYTDLTTVFDKDVINDETLGITNIDIDFNSSMAPMITINFIDVRGSSIFQNEDHISGNNSGNKYGVFFQLPYPIFELEIKGYYGRPVTYCLHMLKFNSKFNSKTGNFEIQCEFIGYTYAMLSDMLIGFLKAIGNTQQGIDAYKNYKDNKNLNKLSNKNINPVLTLDELMVKISEINKGAVKISNTSQNAIANNVIKLGLEQLNSIETEINLLGDKIQGNSGPLSSNNIDKFEFIIKPATIQGFGVNNNILNVFNVNPETPTTEQDILQGYRNNIKKSIEIFNGYKINDLTLDINFFQSITSIEKGKGFYPNITKKELDPLNISTDTRFGQNIGSTLNGIEFKSKLLNFLNKNYTSLDDEKALDVYDMTELFEKIIEKRKELEDYQKTFTRNLANELKNNASATLGFEPTVRNIIEIFTAAIEVFMEVLYNVSFKAESSIPRNNELKPKFNINKTSTDIKGQYIDSDKFFAWPDYREKNEKDGTYVEKYLGASGVLNDKTKVTELNFIDDLLKGFLASAQKTADVISDASDKTTTWYPINPLDSELFNGFDPYSRIESIYLEDIERLLLIRGMTFLAYSNDEKILSTDEIISMGQIEGEAILRGVKNPKIRNLLFNIKLDTIVKSKGIINGLNENVIKLSDNKFVFYGAGEVSLNI